MAGESNIKILFVLMVDETLDGGVSLIASWMKYISADIQFPGWIPGDVEGQLSGKWIGLIVGVKIEVKVGGEWSSPHWMLNDHLGIDFSSLWFGEFLVSDLNLYYII